MGLGRLSSFSSSLLTILVSSIFCIWQQSSLTWSFSLSSVPTVALRETFPTRSKGTMLCFSQDEYGIYQDGKVDVTREPDSIFQLCYRIYNPTGDLTPLVILHGGPSLPSPYLYPLVPMLSKQRPIIFYDQLGCGGSDEPMDLSFYSIPLFVQDLNVVLDHTLSRLGQAKHFSTDTTKSIPPMYSFHLFGHSFGGSLAYEYIQHNPHQKGQSTDKTMQQPSDSRASSQQNGVVTKVFQSLILCNGIQNMRVSNNNYDQLFQNDPARFWTRHACRVGIPPSLQQSLDQLGKTWNGMTSVIDYVASSNNNGDYEENNNQKNPSWIYPPCLIMTGEYDFARPASNDQVWKPLFLGTKVESFEFRDCGHYPFYEEPDLFGSTLRRFLERVDENCQ